ncbi:MAG TPA: hypothetical protein VF273_03580 [Pelobium sp.]
MKNLKIISYVVLLIFASCGGRTNNDQQKADSLKHENDSLKQKIAETKFVEDTIIKNAEGENPEIQPSEVKSINKDKRGGIHPITLQWIGWNKPGYADVKPLEGDWYSISGLQKNKQGDFLRIKGKIRRINEKELLFNGTIITKVKYNNNGKECVKNGVQTFYAKGNRDYFRLQDMSNCEGGMLVDYVDIFTGSSTL